MIGSKFVGPNSFYNRVTKEFWSVLPTLSADETRIQRGLLRSPPNAAPAYRSKYTPGSGRVHPGLGGSQLVAEINGLSANVGFGGLVGSTFVNFMDPAPGEWWDQYALRNALHPYETGFCPPEKTS